jgi:hypothetical protein
MRNFIDIDHVHSRAIAREIGERLGTSLKLEPELASLKIQIGSGNWRNSHRPSFPIWSIKRAGRAKDGSAEQGASNAIGATPCFKDFERVW